MNDEMVTITETTTKQELLSVAKRIYESTPWWDREYTIEEIAKDTAENPISAIKWLLDQLENE